MKYPVTRDDGIVRLRPSYALVVTPMLRADLGYASYLAGELRDYFHHVEMASGEAIFARRAAEYGEEIAAVDAAIGPHDLTLLRHADARDPLLVRQAEESTKRQEAERASQTGENSPSAESSPASDYVARRLAKAKEDKAERDGEGSELIERDHGQGKTPRGGGRGIF